MIPSQKNPWKILNVVTIQGNRFFLIVRNIIFIKMFSLFILVKGTMYFYQSLWINKVFLFLFSDHYPKRNVEKMR